MLCTQSLPCRPVDADRAAAWQAFLRRQDAHYAHEAACRGVPYVPLGQAEVQVASQLAAGFGLSPPPLGLSAEQLPGELVVDGGIPGEAHMTAGDLDVLHPRVGVDTGLPVHHGVLAAVDAGDRDV
jgi:hypothetical protein